MLDRIIDWSFDVVMALVGLGTLALLVMAVLHLVGVLPCPHEQGWL